MSLNLIYRDTKGSPLTAAEGDANMRAINTAVSALQAAVGTTALVDQATTTWDYSAGNVATWTANGSRTLQITNLPSGVASGLLVFVQGVAGGYTPSLGGLTAASFAIAQGANAVTLLDFTKVGSVLYWNSTPFGAVTTPGSGGGGTPTATTLAQSQAALQTYITRTNNTGVSLSNTQKGAITDLSSGIFQAGLYDKIPEFYPILGGTTGAHSISFKGSYDLSFSGPVIHSSTGFIGDGISGHAKTGLIPRTVLSKDSASMGYYGRTQTQNSGDVMGALQGNDIAMRMVVRDNGSDRLFSEIGSASQRIDLPSGGASSQGFFVSNRSSANQFSVYRNGQVIGTNTDTNTGVLPTGDIYLGGLNKAGLITNLSSNECAFAYVGIGLTDAEVATLSSLVQQYQTTLGRAV